MFPIIAQVQLDVEMPNKCERGVPTYVLEDFCLAVGYIADPWVVDPLCLNCVLSCIVSPRRVPFNRDDIHKGAPKLVL